MKETHEQRKTKIDIDEFRSGTTYIILFDRGNDISNKREGLNKGEYIICWGGLTMTE
jgi:hypothetical protein